MALNDIPPTLENSDPISLIPEFSRTLVGPWQAPTLVNGWTNYGGTFARVRFRRNLGNVELDGFIRNGARSGVIFTLPPEFRPRSIRNVLALHGGSGVCMLRFQTNGDVQILNAPSSGQLWLSLSGISVPID